MYIKSCEWEHDEATRAFIRLPAVKCICNVSTTRHIQEVAAIYSKYLKYKLIRLYWYLRPYSNPFQAQRTCTGVWSSPRSISDTRLSVCPSECFSSKGEVVPQLCSAGWIERWHKCITIDGDYFDGDDIDPDEQTGSQSFSNEFRKLFEWDVICMCCCTTWKISRFGINIKWTATNRIDTSIHYVQIIE